LHNDGNEAKRRICRDKEEGPSEQIGGEKGSGEKGSGEKGRCKDNGHANRCGCGCAKNSAEISLFAGLTGDLVYG
jgi:hypothetical protein